MDVPGDERAGRSSIDLDDSSGNSLSTLGYGPIAAILVTLGGFFVSQFAAAIIVLVPLMALGWSNAEIVSWVSGNEYGRGASSLLVAIVMLSIVGWFLHRRRVSWQAIGWKKPKWSDAVSAALGAVSYLALTLIVMSLVKGLIPALDLEQQQQIGFEAGIMGAPLVIAFVSLVVLPPLMEEVLFRGLLFTGLRKKIPVIGAALITSVIFAAAHLQWGGDTPLLWSAAIDTFVLSLVLVYLRVRSDSLWPAIGLHAIKNGLAFMVIFVFRVA